MLQALIPVFKGRAVDPQREKDTDIERCEVIVEDGPEDIKSRLIIKMICRHGNEFASMASILQNLTLRRGAQNISFNFRGSRYNACAL